MVDEELDNIPELGDSLPFMQSFPFKEYEVTLQNIPGKSPQELGIDPIIINEFGSLEPSKRVNFSYVSRESTMMVSFYLDDLVYIEANQHLIKKMDHMLKELDSGLNSSDPNEKIKTIKKGRTFVKKLKSVTLDSPIFEEVLLDICEIKEINLATNIILDLHKLNIHGSLKSDELTKRERETIADYLDFQIHYAKIILGVVIAAKIH